MLTRGLPGRPSRACEPHKNRCLRCSASRAQAPRPYAADRLAAPKARALGLGHTPSAVDNTAPIDQDANVRTATVCGWIAAGRLPSSGLTELGGIERVRERVCRTSDHEHAAIL